MHNKKLIRALRGETFDVPPFWFLRQAGRYLPEYRDIRQKAKNFLQLCYTLDLAVEITLQPIRRWKPDAAIVFSDILVIPDALGQNVTFTEGVGPTLKPILSIDQLKNKGIVDIDQKLSPVYKILEKLKSKLDNSTTLIGFAGGPWTVAVYMVQGKSDRDCHFVRNYAYQCRSAFSELIDLITEATTKYLLGQIKHGAEVIQIFDSWAGVLSDEEFEAWVIEPTRKIVKRIKKEAPDVAIIGFPRLSGTKYVDFVKGTDVDGVNLDETVPLEWAAENIQPLATVQGNLDNNLLLAGGGRLIDRVEKILDTFKEKPYIFNLGHGVLPKTPVNNLQTVIDLIKRQRLKE